MSCNGRHLTPLPPGSKEIRAGTNVRLKGMKGWYVVKQMSGNQLFCTRKTASGDEQVWTDFDQVVGISNNKTKGKKT